MPEPKEPRLKPCSLTPGSQSSARCGSVHAPVHQRLETVGKESDAVFIAALPARSMHRDPIFRGLQQVCLSRFNVETCPSRMDDADNIITPEHTEVPMELWAGRCPVSYCDFFRQCQLLSSHHLTHGHEMRSFYAA